MRDTANVSVVLTNVMTGTSVTIDVLTADIRTDISATATATVMNRLSAVLNDLHAAAMDLGTATNVATACVPTATTDLGSTANMATTATDLSSTANMPTTAASVSGRSSCSWSSCRRSAMPASSKHGARRK